ncbi:MAG: HAMP domain-containing protein [Gammaproteobacteria bacterium]|nr:HAMP domain-containing protein [Gammaproteobacteria bacterium]
MRSHSLTFGTRLMYVVALTTGVAIALVAGALAVVELVSMRPAALSNLSTYAEVLAIHSEAPLAFDDVAAGEETLSALRAVPDVVAAALYDADGKRFATYSGSAETNANVQFDPTMQGHQFVDRQVYLNLPVRFENEVLGTLAVAYDLDRYYRDVATDIAVASVIGLISIFAAMLLALWLRRSLAGPVVELTRAAQKVSLTKDYSIRAQKLSDDELGQLTDTFNRMLSQIEQFQEIQEEAEERQRRYMSELERSNRELDEFAYVASHDLRSPLQGIKSLAEWIAEDNAESLPQKSQRHLEQMQQRVGRLERLLDDLLQYSRAGRVHGTITDVDTRQLCLDTVALLDPPEGFAVNIAEQMPTMKTAPAPLEQVMRNLVNNALKHHDREQGVIDISCRPNGVFNEFTVRDDGPGIDPRYHDQVFKMFETLSPRDDVEGSGMGLAVIKKTVESYGGTIRLESESERGASFTFSWPKEFPVEVSA